MTGQNTMKLLRNIEIFNQCTSEEFMQLEKRLTPRVVAKKQIIFEAGEPCTTVYFIAQGQVKVFKTTEDGREQIINILSANEMFPHIGLFGEGVYPGTTQAMEQCSLYSLSISDFHHLLKENTALSIKLLKILETKIQQLQYRLSQVMNHDMTDKVMNTLNSLAKINGIETPQGIELSMGLTHQDIANLIGTSRETISRVMSQLKKEGKVEYDEQRIVMRT